MKLPPKSINTKPEKKDDYPGKEQWWKANSDDLPAAITATIKASEESQSTREANYKKYLALYGDLEANEYFPGSYSNTRKSLSNRVAYNVVKSCIDTAAARISKNKPRIQFVTDGGDYVLSKKADLLSQYVDGLFYANNYYRLAQEVFLDACIFGTGCIKIFEKDGQVKLERVFINEITVDDYESCYREQRQLHQTKSVYRENLIAQFPEHKDKIISAPSIDKERFTDHRLAQERVIVRESWHLPSGKNQKDGRHAITLENATLLEEQYEKDYFPFVFFRWSSKRFGLYGRPLADELAGIQLDINKTLRNISLAQNLMCVPRVFVESAANINENHLDRTFGSIIRFTGSPPVFSTPPAMSPEVYAHLKDLRQSAYEITGISQSSAQSRKPAGLNSGAAIRAYQDIETERFILVGQDYEDLALDVAKMAVDLQSDICKNNIGVAVSLKGTDFVKKKEWKDIDLDRDQYIMQCFPVSSLPQTPAGRLEAVSELMQTGIIKDEDYALSLLDMPDLKQYRSLHNASLNEINEQLDKMVHEGIYEGPDPRINLQQAIKLSTQAYLRNKRTNIPEERLQLILNYIDDCSELINSMAPPPPELPPAPPQSNPIPPNDAPQ